MTKLKSSKSGKTQHPKLWKISKANIVTKLKKTHTMTQLINSNCDKTQLNLKLTIERGDGIQIPNIIGFSEITKYRILNTTRY